MVESDNITRARLSLHAVHEAKVTPMYTINDLINSTIKFRNRITVNSPPRITIVQMNPIPTNKTLIVKGEAYGTKRYQLTVMFYDVEYSKTPDKDYPLTATLPNHEYVFMKQLQKSTNRVKLRCSCPDSYFRFQHWNHVHAKSLAGPNKPVYQRKTSHYPPVNPCFVGDTRIKMMNGTYSTMEDLSISHKDKKFQVYSYDRTKCKPEVGIAHSPRITGYTSTICKVKLENGHVELCTPEHLWMIKDGTYKPAKNLVPNESLMSFDIDRYLSEQGTGKDFNNYRIQSVESKILNYEVPVYDFTVETYHNFALHSGVFVHNSEIPGICKHLYGLIQRLQRDRILI